MVLHLYCLEQYIAEEGNSCKNYGSKKYENIVNAISDCAKDADCGGFISNCNTGYYSLCESPIIEEPVILKQSCATKTGKYWPTCDLFRKGKWGILSFLCVYL